VCGGSLISAEITRSGGSFVGIITRSTSSCGGVPQLPVLAPLTGSLGANALNFVVNVSGTTSTLTFASTGVAAAASSREKR